MVRASWMTTPTVEEMTIRGLTRGMVQNSRKKEESKESKESKEFEELQEFRSANAISGVTVLVALLRAAVLGKNAFLGRNSGFPVGPAVSTPELLDSCNSPPSTPSGNRLCSSPKFKKCL
jgi:hypothetical protein